jgi:hypothetical protein
MCKQLALNKLDKSKGYLSLTPKGLVKYPLVLDKAKIERISIFATINNKYISKKRFMTL